MRDTQQCHSLNKVDQNPFVDMMHVKDAPLLMLQPDGFTQIQSDRDLRGFAWRGICGLLPRVYQVQIIQCSLCLKHYALSKVQTVCKKVYNVQINWVCKEHGIIFEFICIQQQTQMPCTNSNCNEKLINQLVDWSKVDLQLFW